MTFNSNKSFVGENIRLHNGRSYGNDVWVQLVGGQEAIGTSSNVSSAYKTVKSTGKNEPKKHSIHFLFGNQDVTLETPNIWMPEEKFQQMQREKEYAMKFFRPPKTEIQDYLKKSNVNSGINTSEIASFDLRKTEPTAMRTNYRASVADATLLGNGKQHSYGLATDAPDINRQSIGKMMPEQYMVNLATGSDTDNSLQEIPKIGHNPTPWWNKGDLGTGELVVMPEFFATVDDVVRYYGGWAGVEKEIPEEMLVGFRTAYAFLSTWGLEYVDFLVRKAPMPPNVRLVIEVACFMMMVCEVANEVQKKRKEMIDDLTTGETPISIAEAEAEADKNTHKWLLEEIEKVVIDTVVGNVLNRLPWETYSRKYSNEYTKEATISAIKALWDAFVTAAEADVWVRGIV